MKTKKNGNREYRGKREGMKKLYQMSCKRNTKLRICQDLLENLQPMLCIKSTSLSVSDKRAPRGESRSRLWINNKNNNNKKKPSMRNLRNVSRNYKPKDLEPQLVFSSIMPTGLRSV